MLADKIDLVAIDAAGSPSAEILRTDFALSFAGARCRRQVPGSFDSKPRGAPFRPTLAARPSPTRPSGARRTRPRSAPELCLRFPS
jgi:hypothetical protein